jgi:hypothetical protein
VDISLNPIAPAFSGIVSGSNPTMQTINVTNLELALWTGV